MARAQGHPPTTERFGPWAGRWFVSACGLARIVLDGGLTVSRGAGGAR